MGRRIMMCHTEDSISHNKHSFSDKHKHIFSVSLSPSHSNTLTNMCAEASLHTHPGPSSVSFCH